MSAVDPVPVLRVRELSVAYRVRRRTVPAVRGVSFDVHRGEVVAVVGESGSGKTTTAGAVTGLLPATASVSAGTVELGGQDITGWSDTRMETVRGARIGLVPQDPTVSLNPTKRIGEQIAEVLRIHGRADRRAAAAAAVEILRHSGFRDPERRAAQYPHELSGGMRQRVLIGIATACSPELLIADEPTSALDVTVQRTVLDQLAATAARTGSATLLVTHDLGVAGERADRILVMRDGRIVEQGPVDEVLGEPRDPYTRQLIAAAPSTRSPRLRAAGAVATGPGAPAGPVRPGEPPAVRIDRLTKDYPAGGRRAVFRAVDDVSLTIAPGTTFALVGESGSGKSTVARCVARLVEASTGSVELFGRDVTRLAGAELRRLRARVQLVHQNPFAALNPRLDVQRIIADPLRAFRTGDRRHRATAVAELLDDVGLPRSFGTRRPAELSGGQRQRVAIARAVALRPDLLVLDEPVSALDVSVQAQVLQLLVDLQARLGLTYLLISHDLGVVAQASDTVGVMAGGRLVETGPTAEVYRNPSSEHTRALLDAIPGRRTAGGSTR
ncbi:ABC transporter ATP-binding protein [Pseudonocardia kongjuensis]|uniref:ABC transporter ATP-binding protein n=1 Tax=Pseudonocardia kongjuensis TaxID=102227 RepID=A0ABN1Y1V6_9PSEU